MNRLFGALVALLLVFCVSAPPVQAAAPDAVLMPGVELAQGVAQLTGVAISPLLGVSAVGAWHYFRAPEARRASLPWYCHPWAWGGGFCLIGLCFLKDLFGTAAPPLVKKPLDVVELFENKLSALVASSAFVPLVVSQLSQPAPAPTAALSSDLPLATILAFAGIDIRFLTIPLAIIGFLVVWIACHAINVLVAMCPFGFVDGLLKLFKGFLISSVVLTSFVSPWLGAAVSLMILFVAGLLAPWAFRLSVFGAVFGFDIVWPRRGRRRVQVSEPKAFLARPVAGTPVRTYGRLAKTDEGAVAFRYRPWLVLPERSVVLPPGPLVMAKGMFFPSLLHKAEDRRRPRMVLLFLPRYRSHETSIAAHFDIAAIQESPLIKGFRAVRAWFAETLNLGRIPLVKEGESGLEGRA